MIPLKTGGVGTTPKKESTSFEIQNQIGLKFMMTNSQFNKFNFKKVKLDQFKYFKRMHRILDHAKPSSKRKPEE